MSILEKIKEELLQIREQMAKLTEARETAALPADTFLGIVTDPVILATMKWLKFAEALIYSRKSKNTLKSDIMEGNIYGFQEAQGKGWIVDRESIDRFYETDRRRRRSVGSENKRRVSV